MMSASISPIYYWRYITISSKGEAFFSFSNHEGKHWLIPKKNMKTALSLYQPSGKKGKLLKKCFPVFKNIGFIPSVIGAEICAYRLSGELKEILENIFNVDNPEFSVFGGTPSVHQKMTIQLFTRNRIWGYCKVSDAESVKAVFKREQKILNELNRAGVEGMPVCLYRGVLKDNIEIFVQSTMKTNVSKTIHQWDKRHTGFLSRLYERTGKKLPFFQTDFAEILDKLPMQAEKISVIDLGLLNEAIGKARSEFGGKEVFFSAYHGDFTPWNMFVEKGRLFVFDWEYALRFCPPFMDRFHFLVQSGIAIAGKRKDAAGIYARYRSLKEEMKELTEHPDLIFLCYLLTVISQYVGRNDGKALERNVEANMPVWLGLMKMILRND